MKYEALNLYNEIRELGISMYEAAHYAKKSQSWWSQLRSKNVKITFLLFDKKKMTKGEKIREIKRLFPGGKTFSNLKKLKIPRKDIKEYMDAYDPIMRLSGAYLRLENQIKKIKENNKYNPNNKIIGKLASNKIRKTLDQRINEIFTTSY